jgi:tetrahydromethanopterin S-methyltransferase subunit B
MQIPAELLSEKNYEGSRLIEITDEGVLNLTADLTALQQEANPYLEKMEAITPEMDPIYSQIAELEAKKKELQAEVAPIRARYDAEVPFVEEIEQRAVLIKNKLMPIINDLVKDELGEFEKALQTVHKDGKLYVEVQDLLEEKIKQIRASK